MQKYLYLLSYLIRHKYYVAIECFKRGLYYRGLIHDLDKFHPQRFIPYAKAVNGKDINYGLDKNGYMSLTYESNKEYFKAVFEHQSFQKHHWQYWVFFDANGKFFPLEIDDTTIQEIICDWIGAAKARRTPKSFVSWYDSNKDKIILHPNSRAKIESELDKLR